MKKQRGMALLMVLLMMSLMAIVAVNINDHWQRSLARTQSQQDRLRAKWLLLGGGDLRPTAVAAGRRAAQGLGSLWAGVQYAYRRGGSGDTPAPGRCLFQRKRPDPRRRLNGGRR